MKQYTQLELLSEGFWDLHKSPILRGVGKVAKGLSGVAGAATKGGAFLARTLAPELTNPLDRLEKWGRELKGNVEQGFQLGSGGKMKEFGDILYDSGYVIDEKTPIMRQGSNFIAVGYRITGADPKTGKPTGDPEKPITFLFDPMRNFKIVSTSAQDTTRHGHNYDNKPQHISPHKK